MSAESMACNVSLAASCYHASFFGISQELRDLIYAAVISNVSTPPRYPPSTTPHRYSTHKQSPLQYNSYSSQKPYVSCGALLLVNHRINAEVTAAIERVRRRKALTYQLDCVLNEELKIWPTWRAIPAFVREVDVVEMDFRLWDGREKGWMGRENGMETVFYSVFHLLKDFLERGPSFWKPSTVDIKLGVLVLNFITPTVSSACPSEKACQCGSSEDGLNVLHPQQDIKDALALYMQFFYRSKECEKLVQRGGQIRLCTDGKEL